MIVAELPRIGIGDSVFILTPDRDGHDLVQASLASLCFDFVTRQMMGGTNMSFFIVKQLPVPTEMAFEQEAQWNTSVSSAEWIRARVAELMYASWDLEPACQRSNGHTPYQWESERRSAILAELDAAMFHLYGLERDNVDYIMDTFPIVKRKDEAEHGEYRTKRLILEIYDAMAKAIKTGEPYETILDPPPGQGPRHPESSRPKWAKREVTQR
jgi:hypothetical protein